MRTYRTNRGPFATRPFYKPAEIDRMCGDALKAAGLMPDSPEAVRIERFVEKHFKVSPRYEPLPDGVLGYTSFGPSGVTGIVITTALDEEGGSVSERRIRTTLAHAAEQRGMEKAAGIAMDDAKFREGSLQEEAALRIAAAIRKAKEGV